MLSSEEVYRLLEAAVLPANTAATHGALAENLAKRVISGLLEKNDQLTKKNAWDADRRGEAQDFPESFRNSGVASGSDRRWTPVKRPPWS